MERGYTVAWLPAGALLVAALGLGLPASSGAGTLETWDDGHMKSRLGGPRSGPLEAQPILGETRFAGEDGAVPTAVQEQILSGSQHPWSGRVSGLGGASGGSRAARRSSARTETRHTRNPGAWSRSTQSTGLRAGAVRRSAGGR